MNAYNFLENHFKEISTIEQIMLILSWDESVTMPSGSLSARIEHTSYLIKLIHEKTCSPIVQDKITEAMENTAMLNDWQKANLLEMKKRFDSYSSVDSKLMQEYSSLSKECEMIWRSAKLNNSFKEVKPFLEKLIASARKVAKSKADYFNTSPYQALVDEYDPGRKIEEIDVVFTELQQFLPGFIEKVSNIQDKKPDITGHFPAEQQQKLAKEIMQDLGFDFNKGRLDSSSHPFCGGISQDIRLTTRYDESNLFLALQGVIHETGHALYEANLPQEYICQPVGQTIGMAIHESQSLLTEMQIGRSDEFIAYLIPKIEKYFPGYTNKFSKQQIDKYVRYVEPSFIRVDADEVTYPLHVIFRYNLEKKLIEGDLEVNDLPLAWNYHFKQVLGLTPPNDALGCLQDIHWYCGLFGYFPSYTLGAVTAAQLMNSLNKAIPQTNESIRSGKFKPIYEWLKTNIHSKGRLYSVDQLLINATGESLNAKYFIEYLNNRYLES